MRRHRDRYGNYTSQGERGGQLRGRYARDDGAGRAEGVHWEPDSHLPGSVPGSAPADG